MRGRVLIIAGSDSGGGAGIQADIKTITAFGAYAATAITALTAQNTLGVQAVHMVPPDFIARQIVVVLDDIGADVVKTGMLGDAATIEVVCDTLARHAAGMPVVVDPVMVATSGARLLADDAVAMLRDRLLPMAQRDHAEPAGSRGADRHGDSERRDDASRRVRALLTLGAPAVLLKGGHLHGEQVVDLLATADGIEEFIAPRIETRHTHGTGCTLASGVAAGLAQGLALRDAVLRARDYVRAAIETAPGFGAGHGPLNHAVGVSTG